MSFLVVLGLVYAAAHFFDFDDNWIVIFFIAWVIHSFVLGPDDEDSDVKQALAPGTQALIEDIVNGIEPINEHLIDGMRGSLGVTIDETPATTHHKVE